jgi:hypothetical protein
MLHKPPIPSVEKAPAYVCDCSLAKDSGIYLAMLAIINMILEPEMNA